LIAGGLICFGSFVTAAQSGAGAAGTTDTSVWSGVYTDAQGARGKELYVKNCASCHGDTLGGKAISDSSSPPALKGERFVANWVDLTLQDLHARISTTMPPDSPGSLTPQVYADVIAFLLKENQFPAGTKELSADAARLKGIVIKKDK
jgi:mono/diheme cytochrome c family protein